MLSYLLVARRRDGRLSILNRIVCAALAGACIITVISLTLTGGLEILSM